MYVGEELQETLEVDIEPNGTSPVSFRVNAPEKGLLYGRLQLPADSLSTTNRFYFAAGIGKRLRALVIDGDPKRGLQDSETFFIVNALSAAPLGGESPVLTRVVASYELNNVQWDEYDYVIACNLGRWPEQGRQGLRGFRRKRRRPFLGHGRVVERKGYGARLAAGDAGRTRNAAPVPEPQDRAGRRSAPGLLFAGGERRAVFLRLASGPHHAA